MAIARHGTRTEKIEVLDSGGQVGGGKVMTFIITSKAKVTTKGQARGKNLALHYCCCLKVALRWGPRGSSSTTFGTPQQKVVL